MMWSFMRGPNVEGFRDLNRHLGSRHRHPWRTIRAYRQTVRLAEREQSADE